MRTVILAAGQGTRLRPFTDEVPKCMVPLAGKPLLHWQLDSMAQCGVINNILIMGGYKANRLDAKHAAITINPRYMQTNMLGTLFCAREHMTAGEDLLISYGDIIFEPGVLQAVLNSSAEVSIAADRKWRQLWELRMDDPLSDAETFRMTETKQIIELGKKPKSYDEVQAQYIGLIRIRGDRVTQFINAYDNLDKTKLYDEKDFDNMYMTSFIQYLIDNAWDVKACLIDGGWLEVDTVDDKNRYEHMLSQGALDLYCDLNKLNNELTVGN